MEIEIISLFEEYFKGPFDVSMIKRARQKGLLDIRHHSLRDYSMDKHKKVDDRPFGGGPGMLLQAEPILRAIGTLKRPDSHVVYLSPQGKKLDANLCRNLAKKSHLILVCGHYEGIDERAFSAIDQEVSIGDYVLTNGALAAIVLVDAMVRFVPKVLGDEQSNEEDSFSTNLGGLLDTAHYTRPAEINILGQNVGVPKTLLEGDHCQVAKWRQKSSIEKTFEARPDLYMNYLDRAAGKGKGSFEMVLAVKDLVASARFYRKTLCMRQEKSETNECRSRQFLLPQESTGGVRVILVEGKQEQQGAVNLFRWWIKERTLFNKVRHNLITQKCVLDESEDGSLIFKDLDGHAWCMSYLSEGE